MDAVQSQDDASRRIVSEFESSLSPSSDLTDENRPPMTLPPDKMPTVVEDSAKVAAALFDRNRGPRPPIPGKFAEFLPFILVFISHIFMYSFPQYNSSYFRLYPGEETTPPCSDGTGSSGGGHSSPPPPPPPLEPWKKKQLLQRMEMSKPVSSPAAPSPGDVSVPEGSAAESARTSRSVSPSNRSEGASSTSSSSSSLRGRPPCFDWANSLKNLLSDSEGLDLFQNFLDQEQCPLHSLQFWFACRGFGMQNEQGQPDIEVNFFSLLHSN